VFLQGEDRDRTVNDKSSVSELASLEVHWDLLMLTILAQRIRNVKFQNGKKSKFEKKVSVQVEKCTWHHNILFVIFGLIFQISPHPRDKFFIIFVWGKVFILPHNLSS
jgi:hypothetical protein